ncbi:MAG: prepilin-type N-terminal cleavage/methylation domain-containing protein [Betaproteobacteria bacterium]|nr:prepilin-type N-terminal cleavage/methylation domain-containing protein [Betaproteobacteria bacterium]
MARTSATGTRRASLARATGSESSDVARPLAARRPQQAGFTLIEILVVVAIAGIVLAVAAVNLFPSDEEIARKESSLIALDLEAARDDAWFGGMPTAVSLEDGRIRTMRLDAERAWSTMPGRDRTLPAGVRIDGLVIDGTPVDLREKLVFLPDGMGVPFRVAMQVRGLPKVVDGDAAGRVRAHAP